ncbi:MAG: metalloregulator ArsR/SmtB family transcription factor [Candidatus Eisenbacteria bacterium]
MRDFELAMKAASDPTRTRILKLLEGGGLCVCQVQAVLGLAPSTVSKHLSILRTAGLVEDHRDGRWIEYTLAPEGRTRFTGSVLALLRGPLDRDPEISADRKRLREIKAISLEQLCAATPSHPLPPAVRGRSRPGRKERARV